MIFKDAKTSSDPAGNIVAAKKDEKNRNIKSDKFSTISILSNYLCHHSP